MASIRDRIESKLRRQKNNRIINQEKKELRIKDLSIISQNCIGGVFYHDMGLRFLSPTIDLFIPEPDFVRMVLDLRRYMESEIVISMGEICPVGVLGNDVSVHFLHYTSCEEALEKWNARKERINWDRIMVFSTDRDGFSDEVFNMWQQIEYPKVLFTANRKYEADDSVIFFPEHEHEKELPDLIPEREFYRNGRLIELVNRMVHGS